MGYKMGLNGIDNAKLAFDNVRVPRVNLLNAQSEVSNIITRLLQKENLIFNIIFKYYFQEEDNKKIYDNLILINLTV